MMQHIPAHGQTAQTYPQDDARRHKLQHMLLRAEGQQEIERTGEIVGIYRGKVHAQSYIPCIVQAPAARQLISQLREKWRVLVVHIRTQHGIIFERIYAARGADDREDKYRYEKCSRQRLYVREKRCAALLRLGGLRPVIAHLLRACSAPRAVSLF